MAIAIVITRPSRSNPDRVEYLSPNSQTEWTDNIFKAKEFPFVDEETAKAEVMFQTGSEGAGCDFVRVVPKSEMVY